MFAGIFGVVFIGFVLHCYTNWVDNFYEGKVKFKPVPTKEGTLFLDDDEKDLFGRPLGGKGQNFIKILVLFVFYSKIFTYVIFIINQCTLIVSPWKHKVLGLLKPGRVRPNFPSFKISQTNFSNVSFQRYCNSKINSFLCCP